MKTTRPLIVISILVMMLNNELKAQFSAGLKAGLNLSTLSVDEENTKYNFLPGYQAGAFAEYAMNKFSLQLDVLYSLQGAKIKSNNEDLKATARYVNIPLAVKYKISPSFNLHLGPQIGFLTCLHSDYHPVTHEPFQEQDYTKAYKKTDFGMNIGGGWTRANFIIDLRYYHGLTDINNYPGIGATKNRVIQLTLGYKLYQR